MKMTKLLELMYTLDQNYYADKIKAFIDDLAKELLNETALNINVSNGCLEFKSSSYEGKNILDITENIYFELEWNIDVTIILDEVTSDVPAYADITIGKPETTKLIFHLMEESFDYSDDKEMHKLINYNLT